MKRLIAAIAIVLATCPFAARATGLGGEDFARDFQTAAYESYSFTQGKSASFYKNTDDHGYGFALGGVLDSTDKAPDLSSGLAFGEGAADLEHNAKLTTMMMSGTLDLPGFSPHFLRPYVLAGAGLAVYDTSASLAPDARGTDVIPVFKLGGGLALRMGQMFDLAFSYKAGFASGGSPVSGRSQQSADLQMVDVSLKYKF
ncbi:MAG TPA: hypothetical protein VHB73_04010 [Alphaproteobacteria bacterium]|nr:hypothetical protein [Alphaproteobacteria bacterium]